MSAKIVKIQDGTITLPKELRRKWQQAEVLIMPSEENDSLLVKKIQKSKLKLSELAKIVKLPRMSTGQVQKEIENYRRGQ